MRMRRMGSRRLRRRMRRRMSRRKTGKQCTCVENYKTAVPHNKLIEHDCGVP